MKTSRSYSPRSALSVSGSGGGGGARCVTFSSTPLQEVGRPPGINMSHSEAKTNDAVVAVGEAGDENSNLSTPASCVSNGRTYSYPGHASAFKVA